MNAEVRRMAIPGLRWTLGLVLILESLRLALDTTAARHFANAGMPQWLRPALAWPEIVAAILFLVPLTTMLGGYLLLAVFLAAAALHFLHGEFQVGGLVVYAMAVLVCMTQRAATTVKASL
jgi:DoxX-like family